MWEGLREPVQVVYKNVVLPLTEVVLDSGTENVAEQLWSRFDPRRNRLDISQAPMLRLIVTHDTTQEKWLLQWWYSHLLGITWRWRSCKKRYRRIYWGRRTNYLLHCPSATW